MITEVLPINHQIAISHAADIIKHNGLIAFPTDTVYGIGALATSEETIERLFIVKGRKRSQAVALLISTPSEMTRIATDIPENAWKLAEEFWPGPLTIVLKRNPALPKIISPLPTVGIRVPNHPFVLALLRETGPLAVTSANRSGEPSAINARQVLDQLSGKIHLLIDGGTAIGRIPSTVIDCTTDPITVLRDGPISHKELMKAVRKTP